MECSDLRGRYFSVRTIAGRGSWLITGRNWLHHPVAVDDACYYAGSNGCQQELVSILHPVITTRRCPEAALLAPVVDHPWFVVWAVIAIATMPYSIAIK